MWQTMPTFWLHTVSWENYFPLRIACLFSYGKEIVTPFAPKVSLAEAVLHASWIGKKKKDKLPSSCETMLFLERCSSTPIGIPRRPFFFLLDNMCLCYNKVAPHTNNFRSRRKIRPASAVQGDAVGWAIKQKVTAGRRTVTTQCMTSSSSEISSELETFYRCCYGRQKINRYIMFSLCRSVWRRCANQCVEKCYSWTATDVWHADTHLNDVSLTQWIEKRSVNQQNFIHCLILHVRVFRNRVLRFCIFHLWIIKTTSNWIRIYKTLPRTCISLAVSCR